MKLTAFIEGVGLGVLATYLFDPDRGGRRRAIIRDKFVHQSVSKRDALHIMLRDFANRSRGLSRRVQRRLDRSSVGDEILIERVRAEMGRHVSHFHAIDIQCDNGTVRLSGPILASEIQDCIWHARMVPGVKHVVNALESHASSENIPQLQGPVQAIVQQRWTPATSLVMAVTGVLFTAYGTGKKGVVGTAMQIAGVGMVAKAFHDTENRFAPSRKSEVNRLLPGDHSPEFHDGKGERSRSAIQRS